MKKTVLSIVMVAFAMVALAHPPKKVSITYDKETGKITVTAEHSVKDVKKHYISKAYVMVNDEEIKVEEFTEQTDLTTAVLVIDMPELKAGDIVKVKAKCNKSGARAAEIIIE